MKPEFPHASESFKAANPHLFGKSNGITVQAEIVSSGLPYATNTTDAVIGKRIRQNQKPLMNKLESDFYEILKRTNPLARAQAFKLRLGNGIVYTPDFIDLTVLPVTAWECKGPHAFRGGFENLKVAASLFTEVLFVLVWRKDGQWKQQTVLA